MEKDGERRRKMEKGRIMTEMDSKVREKYGKGRRRTEKYAEGRIRMVKSCERQLRTEDSKGLMRTVKYIGQ